MIKDVYIEVKTNGGSLAYYREKGYSLENKTPQQYKEFKEKQNESGNVSSNI